MPDISSAEAAAIINVSSQTIRRQIQRGLLKARFEGPKGIVKIEIDDLRRFADDYQYRFDEDLAKELVK